MYPWILLVLVTRMAAELLTRQAVLSPGHLKLVWTPGQDFLVLRVEARTLGFFALSFGSVHGGAAQDAVLGWTSDAEVLLQDGVVGRDGRIASDRVNDYELLEGARNDSSFLSVTLQRRWSTCDEIEDFPLGAGSVLVSWALYPRPPDNLETFPRLQDGERHGSLVIVFNAPPAPEPPSAGLHFWPVLMPQVRLSSNMSAVRWCAVFQAPEMRARHWIVGFRAEVQHTEVVKQMLLMECRTDLSEIPVTSGLAGRPCVDTLPCQTAVLVWTPGNDETIFPRDVGVPIGTNFGGTDYYMLQVLYSFTDSTSEGADSSGLQVLLTSRKPKHQAALMQVGVRAQATLVLPPRQPSVATRGWCLDTCLEQVLPNSGITVASVLLQARSAARRILLRHLQDYDELPPVVMDMGYQADQQETRILDPRVHVKPGDSLALECQYNTQDRDRATLGGPSSDDEICSAYILYYPRISLSSCLTQPSDNILEILGIKPKLAPSNEIIEVIVSNKTTLLKDALQSVDWGANNISSHIDLVQKELLHQGIMPYCLNAYGDQIDTFTDNLPLYQDHLVPLNKVTRCGIWDKALRQERQRNRAANIIPMFTLLFFTLSLM